MPTTTTPDRRHPDAGSPAPDTALRAVERRLVARAAAGDTDALTRLMGLHRRRLVAVARRTTRCPEAAEDVVQDALVKIWRHAHRLDPDRPFLAWAATIVGRTAIDHVRADARARALARRADRPAGEGCPFAAVDDRLDAGLLARRLGSHADDRRLLSWIHVDGDSIECVSDRLGVPVGTVKSRSARARTRLADRLTPAA